MGVRRFALVLAAVLLVSSCGGVGKDAPPAVEGVDTDVSPLTGLKQENPPENPIFLVKIENTAAGTPQFGVHKADLVIQELVEGGVTRLAALYYSDLPTKVGHVRSSRTTDIGLAQPVGATIVASGGAKKALAKIKAAKLRIYTYDAGAPGFSKDPSKSAPYHVLWDLTKLAETAKPGVIRTHYFKFGKGPAAADVTKKTTRASVTFSPATTTDWRFAGGKWELVNDRAAAGESYKADTVVTIFARVTDAGYTDPAGNPVPETVVEGTGRAVIFSGGSATEATWKKSGLDGQMSFTSKATGKPIGLKPGKIWLEVAPRGGSVTY